MSAMPSTQAAHAIVTKAGYSSVKHVSVLQSLWAGYGKLYRCTADDDALVVKHFTPPVHAEDDSEDHMRKLRSYEVERVFYETLSEKLLKSGCVVPECIGCFSDDGSIAIVMKDLGSVHGAYDVRRGNCLTMGEGMRLLSYLAKFHAINWGLQVEGLWEEGCFWQLGTRMDELNYLDRSWKRYGLDRDMAVRIHELVRRLPHRTIVHGDAKAANFFWFKDDSTIGGYDLQYCGMASPMRDIAYMLGCSMQEHLIEEYEETLLRHYHTQLMSHLSTEHAADFTFEVMQSAYDLCVCDLVRFMCGSRWWGNTDYLERKAKTWLSNNG